MKLYRVAVNNTVEDNLDWEPINGINLFLEKKFAKEYLLSLVKEIQDNDMTYYNDPDDKNVKEEIHDIDDYEIDIRVYSLDKETNKFEFESYIKYDVCAHVFTE